jgi:plasmid stabilization system protein ParE
VTRVAFGEDLASDLERIGEHLLHSSSVDAPATMAEIMDALLVLGQHPRIARRVKGELRELVIDVGAGYLALYDYDAARDVVRVHRLRSQREAGYRD